MLSISWPGMTCKHLITVEVRATCQDSIRQVGCPDIPSGPAAFLMLIPLKLFVTLCPQTEAACLSLLGAPTLDAMVWLMFPQSMHMSCWTLQPERRPQSLSCSTLLCSSLCSVVPVVSIWNSQSVVIVIPVSSWTSAWPPSLLYRCCMMQLCIHPCCQLQVLW